MRTALLQLNVSDDPAANLTQTVQMIRDAAADGAKFILTPEVTNCIPNSRRHQNEVLQHEDVDHYVLIWFWSWVVFISCLVTDVSTVDVPTRTIDALTIVAGMACVVSALLASRLVMEISKRQDARLFAIIHEVDEESNAKPVTDQDIAAAWSRSAGMIDIPR